MHKHTNRLHALFYEPESRGFVVVNDFLALLTLVSVFSLILETVPRFAAYAPVFTVIEYVTVFFFSLEYLARIIAERRDAGAYLFSFFGVIDLLAIVPTYLGIANLTFLKTARVLRILRLLRMVRLAKIARSMKRRKKDLENYYTIYRLNISIYFFSLLSAVIVLGTLIYIAEGTNPAYGSIPLGMLWAIKPLMGGVAQSEPVTVAGEFIAILARFVGLILFGLLIAIIGNVVKRLLFGTTNIEGT